MPKGIPSVGDLRSKSEITDAEIEAATEAYMKDEGAPPFVLSSGHQIDVGRAIDMHPQAKKLLADEATAPGLRRTMVRTAVVMGFPVGGWARLPHPQSGLRLIRCLATLRFSLSEGHHPLTALPIGDRSIKPE